MFLNEFSRNETFPLFSLYFSVFGGFNKGTN